MCLNDLCAVDETLQIMEATQLANPQLRCFIVCFADCLLVICPENQMSLSAPLGFLLGRDTKSASEVQTDYFCAYLPQRIFNRAFDPNILKDSGYYVFDI